VSDSTLEVIRHPLIEHKLSFMRDKRTAPTEFKALLDQITLLMTFHVTLGLEGDEVSIEADELLARLFQHELDHLDGVLLVDHLEKAERKDALREWRVQLAQLQSGTNGPVAGGPVPLVGRSDSGG